MRREVWSTLAVLQPSQAGAQAAARRGLGKEAAKPTQPRDALSSSRGSTLHAEPCRSRANRLCPSQPPKLPPSLPPAERPGPPRASSS